MGLRDTLRRLKREARGEMYEIPQHDGTVKRFPQSAAPEALIALIDGRDHPLAQAARNSPAPEWANSFFSSVPMEGVEDLSEGAQT
jgi:hypothetical protein